MITPYEVVKIVLKTHDKSSLITVDLTKVNELITIISLLKSTYKYLSISLVNQ